MLSRVGDKDEYLTYSYKKFDGEIKYVIDENDIIKEFMSVYYKKMINENKDTIHVSLKDWKSHSTLTLLATQNYPFWLKYDCPLWLK